MPSSISGINPNHIGNADKILCAYDLNTTVISRNINSDIIAIDYQAASASGVYKLRETITYDSDGEFYSSIFEYMLIASLD